MARLRLTASTLGYDVALRIELDVGKAIIDKAPTKIEGLDRLQEMKDYVREVVAAEYAAERTSVRLLILPVAIAIPRVLQK